MKQLTKADDMVGKTIVGAYVFSWQIVLNLGGGDYVAITPTHDYDDGARLKLDDMPGLCYLVDAGVIGQEEADRLMEEKDAQTNDTIKTRELATLRKLMNKYPEWSK